MTEISNVTRYSLTKTTGSPEPGTRLLKLFPSSFAWKQYRGSPRRNKLTILFFLVGALISILTGGWGGRSEATELATASHYYLSKAAPSRNFECVFPIPDEEWDQGVGWISRNIVVSNSLAIVEECLSRRIYYVIVRLVGKSDQAVRGSIYLKLQKGPANTPMPPVLPAPKNIQVFGRPLHPDFMFDGEGETAAFRLFQFPGGDEIWAKGFTGGGWGHLDEGSLKINHRYLLEARQGNGAARYSPPGYLEFQVIGIPKVCPLCHGSGVWPPSVPSTGKENPCSVCRGSGTTFMPALATQTTEPFCPTDEGAMNTSHLMSPAK